MPRRQDLIDKVERLQNICIARATHMAYDNDEYRQLRGELLEEPTVADGLPRFVRTAGDLDQLWLYMRRHANNYEDRRTHESLRFAGANISSIFGLVNSRAGYPELIPTLITILPTVSDTWLREGVVRALWVKEARGKAGPALIREFARPDAPLTYLWAVGNALSIVAVPELFDSLKAVILDRRFKTARQMLAAALVRAGKARAEPVLIQLLDDPDILPHVIRELGKLRSKLAIGVLEKLAVHDSPLVRTEVRKALARINAV